MAIMGKITCTKCGFENRSKGRFCTRCGEPLEGGRKTAGTCPHCGRPVKMGAKFCTSCGKAIDAHEIAEQAIKDERNEPKVLHKQEGAFAERVTLSQPHQILNTGIIVEPGMTAYVFVDGEFGACISEGVYRSRETMDAAQDLEGPMRVVRELLKRMGKVRPDGFYPSVVALVVDSTKSLVTLTAKEIFTADQLRADVTASLYVSVLDAEVFMATVLKGKNAHDIQAVISDLSPSFLQICESLAQTMTFSELSSPGEKHESFKKQLMTLLQAAVGPSGYGVSDLTGVRVLEAGLLKAAGTTAEAKETRAQREAEVDLEKVNVDYESSMLEIERRRIDAQAEQESHVAEVQHGLDLQQSDRGQELERRQRQHARENLEDDMQTSKFTADFERSEKIADADNSARIADIADEQQTRTRERDLGIRRQESELKEQEADADFQRFQAMQEMYNSHDEKMKGMDANVEIERARANREHFDESKDFLEKQAEMVERLSRQQGDTLAGLAGKMADALSSAAGAQSNLQNERQRDVKEMAEKSVESMAHVAGSRALGEGMGKGLSLVCKHCSAQLEAESQFCPECGKPVE